MEVTLKGKVVLVTGDGSGLGEATARAFGQAGCMVACVDLEGRPHNIRVTTVIPGGMRTHFFDRFPEQGIPLPDERNLQDPANVAETIVYAVRMPEQSVMQEVIVTPLTETSWP